MLKPIPLPILNQSVCSPTPLELRRRLSSGFTMIELMVSVSIMILLVGGGIASFITFNDKQQLQGSTKMIQTYLRTAQTKARVGDRPEGCTKLEGYEVQVPTGTATLQLVAICEDTQIQVQSTTLENIENISAAGGEDVAVLFKVLHGGTENEGTITLTSTGGATETFHVSAGGEISELGYDPENSTPASTPGGPANSASPSPSTAPQTASPSPNVTPSPSSPSSGIYLNTVTGMSCSQLCTQQNFVRCTSIGTDTAATNGNYRGKTSGLCVTNTGSCTTAMIQADLSCAHLGTTAAAAWTYCKCGN